MLRLLPLGAVVGKNHMAAFTDSDQAVPDAGDVQQNGFRGKRLHFGILDIQPGFSSRIRGDGEANSQRAQNDGIRRGNDLVSDTHAQDREKGQLLPALYASHRRPRVRNACGVNWPGCISTLKVLTGMVLSNPCAT